MSSVISIVTGVGLKFHPATIDDTILPLIMQNIGFEPMATLFKYISIEVGIQADDCYELLAQIITHIAEEGEHVKAAKRNNRYLSGIYSILVSLEHEEAVACWSIICSQRQQCQLLQRHDICRQINRIVDLLEN